MNPLYEIMEDPYKCMIGMLGIVDYTTCPCVGCIQRSFEDEGLDGFGNPFPTNEELYEMGVGE